MIAYQQFNIWDCFRYLLAFCDHVLLINSLPFPVFFSIIDFRHNCILFILLCAYLWWPTAGQLFKLFFRFLLVLNASFSVFRYIVTVMVIFIEEVSISREKHRPLSGKCTILVNIIPMHQQRIGFKLKQNNIFYTVMIKLIEYLDPWPPGTFAF